MNFNKITTRLVALASTLVVSASYAAPASLQSQTETEADPQGQAVPYDGSWESLQTMPVPAWFDDGKIGIFIHWGPYSAIGYRKNGKGYSEHVPKLIYHDSKHYYPYVKERWGAAPPVSYTHPPSPRD